MFLVSQVSDWILIYDADQLGLEKSWKIENSKTYFDLQELFQTNLICLGRVFSCFFLGFEDKTWRKCVSVLAQLTVWTLPEPSKLLCLDSFDEVLADDL